MYDSSFDIPEIPAYDAGNPLFYRYQNDHIDHYIESYHPYHRTTIMGGYL